MAPLSFLLSLLLPIAAAASLLRLSARRVAQLQQQHSKALQGALHRATAALGARRQLRSLNGEALEIKAFDHAVRLVPPICIGVFNKVVSLAFSIALSVSLSVSIYGGVSPLYKYLVSLTGCLPPSPPVPAGCAACGTCCSQQGGSCCSVPVLCSSRMS